jgi:hypothetical protein
MRERGEANNARLSICIVIARRRQRSGVTTDNNLSRDAGGRELLK